MAKDYTKYNVEGIDGEFKKARLVQAILKHYVEIMQCYGKRY